MVEVYCTSDKKYFEHFETFWSLYDRIFSNTVVFEFQIVACDSFSLQIEIQSLGGGDVGHFQEFWQPVPTARFAQDDPANGAQVYSVDLEGVGLS